MAVAHFSKEKLLQCMLVLYLFMVQPNYAARLKNSGMSKQKFEVNKHLNRLNKPPVKSIQSPDGDIIDCVHIDNQPAFDHPFLKNHTILMKPSYYPEGEIGEKNMKNNDESYSVKQLWHLEGKCPDNTIPIRRTKKDDIFRASSVKNFGKKKASDSAIPNPRFSDSNLISQNVHQHAIAYVEGDNYYGAKARMNVWDPKIQQPNEFSLSQMWLLGGTYGQDLNTIEVGWQVSPNLYGDNNTRLFTYWTSDAYAATGCYNLLCSGFVQINNEVAMGASIFPISQYTGLQYDITLLVWKDPEDGNWWMQFGNENGGIIGYWPSVLFSYLGESASIIHWGGEVVNSQSDGQHTTTQMGSGHFPDEGYGKSSYFRDIQIVDDSNILRAPSGISTFTEQSNCYDVQTGKSDVMGTYFYYGGPGRNADCM